VSFVLIFGAVAIVLLALSWALRSPKRGGPADVSSIATIDEPVRQHATYFGVIRQAMSEEDFDFLTARGPLPLVRRAHKERQRIAMLYLGELRADFRRLLRLAGVIAKLSPEVAASHEFARLRLSLRFFWRYRMVRLGLYAGLLLLPQLSGLSLMVSELAFRLELAMKELGDRAAVAAELASTLDRCGLDVA
jgi:hypothetical protein